MSARRAVVLLVSALLVYLALVVERGLWLVGDGRPVTVALGVGVLLLPLAGLWFLWHELRFGLAADRLGRELPDFGDEPARPPGGRPDRGTADAVFARRRTEVEVSPGDWRAWYRLAVAYADARDPRRAREAMRHAIALHRAEATR